MNCSNLWNCLWSKGNYVPNNSSLLIVRNYPAAQKNHVSFSLLQFALQALRSKESSKPLKIKKLLIQDPADDSRFHNTAPLNRKVDGQRAANFESKAIAEINKIGHSKEPQPNLNDEDLNKIKEPNQDNWKKSNKNAMKNIKTFEEALAKIKEEIDKNEKRIQKLYQFQEIFNQLFTVLSNNYEFFLFGLAFFLPEETFEIVKLNLSDKKEPIKFLEALLPINYIKYYHSNKFKAKLAKLGDEYKSFLLDDKKKQQDFHQIYNHILLENEEAEKKCILKFAEFVICRLTPFLIFSETLTGYIPLIKNYQQKTLAKTSKLFFKFLKTRSKLKKLLHANYIRKKWVQSRQSQVMNFTFTGDFQQFATHQNNSPSDLIEDNNRVYEEQNSITTQLKAEKEEFKKKVNVKISSFKMLNENKENLDFVSFKQNFETHNFFSSRMKNISSMEEWRQKTSDEKFIKEICKDSVEYHMTIGKLLKPGLKNMLLEKFKIEKLFLFFNSVKCSLDLLFNIVQWALIIPKLTLSLSYFGLQASFEAGANWLGEDIPFKAAPLLFFVNPDLDISAFSALIIAITHFFGYYHKPHEFSIKGYSISLQARWVHIVYNFVYLQLITIKIGLKIINKMSESQFKKSILKVDFYITLEDRINRNKNNYNNKIENLNKRMLELKKLDIMRHLNPGFCDGLKSYQVLKKYLIENECPQNLITELSRQLRKNGSTDQQLNDQIDQFLESNFLYKREKILKDEVNIKYTYNPINVIIDSLDQADKLMFSEDVINFFKNFTNITFEKSISKQVEKLFTSSCTSFFKLFEEGMKKDIQNRFSN